MKFTLMLMMAVCVLFSSLFSSFARADDKFFLNKDGTVEKRLDNAESTIEKLVARVAVLEKAMAAKGSGPQITTLAQTGPLVLGTSPQSFSLTTAAPKKKISFSVCRNGVCTIHECDDISQVPAGATVLSEVAATPIPCPTGPCGDNCQCRYTTNSFGASATTVQVSSGSGRRGFFGRIADRRHARQANRASASSGGCSTCGQ